MKVWVQLDPSRSPTELISILSDLGFQEAANRSVLLFPTLIEITFSLQ